jgi:hypothetical protein
MRRKETKKDGIRNKMQLARSVTGPYFRSPISKASFHFYGSEMNGRALLQ